MQAPTRRTALAATVAAAVLVPLAGARAQTAPGAYPSRPITLVVPFAPGGPSDAIARLVGQSLSETLKQSVVIENVAGAGGTAGAARVAKAAPDGYALLIHHVALPAAASLYKNLAYDTATAFEPIGLVNTGPMVLMARKDDPAQDAGALLARLRATAGKGEAARPTLAHAGVGSNSHLCGLLLGRALGTGFAEVAYRGTGPAMNDLMGGQVELLCDQSTTAVPQVQGGTVKGYAVTSTGRLDVLKELPTLAEAGLPGFDFTIWHGLYAPAGTPRPVVEVLNRALGVALADVNLRARFADVGTVVFPEGERSPEAHGARFAKEIATWREVVAATGTGK